MDTDGQRRRELYGLLGELPPRERPISATVIGREDRGDYLLEQLVLDLNGMESVPAYFTRPRRPDGERVPAVLYSHTHSGEYALGKDELLDGGTGLTAPAYAQALAGQGYAALCIDQWLFGERRGRSESELFKLTLWQGQVLWGLMMYDSLRALDYLVSRPEVDPDRVAALGLSMGSTMSWWLAALDERVRVCVDLCCLTDYQALIEARGLDGHGLYYYVPGLVRHFTTAQINALIAPRAHLSLAGDLDPLTPPAGLDRVDEELRGAYARAGAPDAWRLRRWQTSHFETAEMRADVLAFLRRWL